MSKSSIAFIAIVVGCVALYAMASDLISTHAVPSLSEFIASSTAGMASSTEPSASTSPLSTLNIQAPDGVIHAFVAATDAERSRGLGDRDPLPVDQGMVFEFADPATYGFWMKDMHFSLDMVWIGPDKRVVGVATDVSPDTYPETFFPPAPVSYVLELDAGSARAFGIATGSALSF